MLRIATARKRLIATAGVLAMLFGGVGCTMPDATDDRTLEAHAVGERAAHTATVLADGGVLVTGGCTVDGCTTATASAAIVRGESVEPTSPMNTARDAHTASVLEGGRVMVAGGFTGEGRPPETSVELYDAASGQWTTAAPLEVGRGGHTAAVTGSGSVVIAGGWVSSRTYTNSVEVFDPTSETFSQGSPLPEAVDGLASIALADGTVLVTGGQSSPGVASSLAVLIHPDGSVVPTAAPLTQARFKHAMVLLEDGRAVVIGGTSDDRDLLTSTEIYDPATGSFTAGPSLLEGRYKLAGAAAALAGGGIVVGGGGPGVELIDVEGGAVTKLDLLSGVSSFGTVTVADGLLYFIGGYDQSIQLRGTFLVTEIPT